MGVQEYRDKRSIGMLCFSWGVVLISKGGEMCSLVVLIFNERPDIGSLIGQIEAVLKQEPLEFEIIPVHDSSPNKTWRLIQEIAKENLPLIDSANDWVAHDYAKGIHIPNSKVLSQREIQQ